MACVRVRLPLLDLASKLPLKIFFCTRLTVDYFAVVPALANGLLHGNWLMFIKILISQRSPGKYALLFPGSHHSFYKVNIFISFM